jgi:hypothetical protein
VLPPRQEHTVQLCSTAFSMMVQYTIEGPLPDVGTLDLVKAVTNRGLQNFHSLFTQS